MQNLLIFHINGMGVIGVLEPWVRIPLSPPVFQTGVRGTLRNWLALDAGAPKPRKKPTPTRPPGFILFPKFHNAVGDNPIAGDPFSHEDNAGSPFARDARDVLKARGAKQDKRYD